MSMDMQKIFVGWEDINVYTDHVWTGSECIIPLTYANASLTRPPSSVMGYSSDGLPHIGAVPGEREQFILAGFTGHGMPLIFLAAQGIAKMVVDGVAFEETGLPRLFKTSQWRIDEAENKILKNMPERRLSQAKLRGWPAELGSGTQVWHPSRATPFNPGMSAKPYYPQSLDINPCCSMQNLPGLEAVAELEWI